MCCITVTDQPHTDYDINDIIYFGSADSRLIAPDFTREECRVFTNRREILREPGSASDKEVSANEVDFIRNLGADDPKVGYNR